MTSSALSLELDTPDLARHYEQVSVDRQFKAGQVLVERVGLHPGERVLDVGCGTGLLAEHVAGVVGERGWVVGVDPLGYRIQIARRKHRHNLHFLVGDAHDLGGFTEEAFDVVYLNAVFHWLKDKPRALSRIHRVLAPGGRLGISTGSKDHVNQLQDIRRRVLAREPYRNYPEAEAGFADRVSAGELRAQLEGAGFEGVAVDVVPHEQLQPTPEAAIEFAQASSFGNFAGHLPDALARAARAEIAAELAELATPAGVRLSSARLVAVAVKPSRS
jgi:ubiquinone/menaquinone biosynthesis C-methylase UbiE